MTVETTLQEMFDGFPDLFSTRQECYNHLFCTVGNGYCWKWGQIVENVYGLEDNKEIHDNDYLHPKVLEAKQSLENIKMKQDMDRELYELKRLDDLEDNGVDIGEYNPNKHHWYPISKHSLINKIPDDIKPDWIKAIEECKEMLKADGIDLNQKRRKNHVKRSKMARR